MRSSLRSRLETIETQLGDRDRCVDRERLRSEAAQMLAAQPGRGGFEAFLDRFGCLGGTAIGAALEAIEDTPLHLEIEAEAELAVFEANPTCQGNSDR